MTDALSLIGRVLLASLFLVSGFDKIGGFAGTAGYIGSVGLPLPEVGAAIAILVEVIAPILLIIGLIVAVHGLGLMEYRPSQGEIEAAEEASR